MIEFKRFLLFFVILFSLIACSPKQDSTAEAPKTPTLLPTFTSTAAMQPGSTLPPIPTSTFMPVTKMPSDFSPILYGKKYDANTFFILLGGRQGQGWLMPDVAFTYFANLPGWDYDVYTLAKGKFQIHGDRPEFSPAHKIYTLRTDVTVDETGMVGVAKGWPVLQRDVQELSPDSEVYRQIVLDWLAAQGVSTPGLDTLHVFRVDLEGDGVDEIFISATRLEDQHLAELGDYSILLMRKVDGDAAVTLPLVADIYLSQDAEMTFPRAYSLGNFLDLNQDGILEVIVDIRRWDGDGAVIYQIDGQNITQVLCNLGQACDGLP